MKNTMKAMIIPALVLLLAGSSLAQGFGSTPPTWYPDDGSRVLVYRAPSSGNGTTTLGFNELIGKDFNYVGYFAAVLKDAGDAGAAPQWDVREITAYTSATGVITVVTAFTALAAGDRVWIGPSTALQAIWGTQGVPAVTGAEFGAGVSIAEGLADIDDEMDTLHAYVTSNIGAQWGTATEPANGVNLFEGLGFAQNQLDSIVGAFYGDVGLQWGAATEPANGVAFDEGVHFLQNQADSIAGAMYGTVGAQWGTATEPANGVNLFEGVGFLQNQADSIVGAFYGDVGLQWGAAAQYANGVALDEVIASIQDLIDTVRVEIGAASGLATFPAAEAPANGVPLAAAVRYNADALDSLEGAFYGTVGVQWGTATEPANGVSLVEGVGFAQNQLDSVVGAFYGDVGLQWGAAAEPANGVAFDEGVHFLQNQADSIAAALYTTTGAQWGTATEPANGVNLFEGVGFLQNQADSIAGAMYGDVGAQWGTATEPANGVDLFEGVGFLQNQADSLQGALNGDVGNQWGTAALPANGVAIDEVIRRISDAVAGANGFNQWEEPVRVVVDFDAAGAWEEAATTHEVFTFTGGGDFEISAYCSTDVTVTSADSIFFISEGGGSIYRCLGTDLDAGEGLFWGVQGTTGTPVIPTATVLDGDVGGVIRGHIEMGRDWGFDIDDNDFTGGIIVIECRFRPTRAGSTVAAGVGGAL